MDWQQRLADLAAPILEFGPAQWLTISTSLAFVVLLFVLALQTRRHGRLKRELATILGERSPAAEVSVEPAAVLEGIALSPIDRVFPRRPAQFLMMVAVVAIGCWV